VANLTDEQEADARDFLDELAGKATGVRIQTWPPDQPMPKTNYMSAYFPTRKMLREKMESLLDIWGSVYIEPESKDDASLFYGYFKDTRKKFQFGPMTDRKKMAATLEPGDRYVVHSGSGSYEGWWQAKKSYEEETLQDAANLPKPGVYRFRTEEG